MRHITWVPLLAALSAIAALVVMTGGASARDTGCEAPCFFPNIIVPLQWVPAGKTTRVTVVVNASNSPKATVSLPNHSPLLVVLRRGSTRYTLVKGVPTWRMYNIRGQKSIHFLFLVRKTAQAGKRMPYTIKAVGTIGGKSWPLTYNMALHVAAPQ